MRRLRRVRLASLLGAVAVGLVGCRALLDLDDNAQSVTPADEAGSETGVIDSSVDTPDTATDSGPPGCNLYVAKEGVYTYEDETPVAPHHERLVQLNPTGTAELGDGGIALPANLANPFYATVRQIAGQIVYHLDYNSLHYDEYTFVAKPNAGLRVSAVTENLLNIPVDVTCDVPAIQCPMVLHSTWNAAAKGLFGGQTFDAKLTFTYVEDESLAIGGELIPTFHVHESRELAGAVSGHAEIDYWFAKADGLLIRAVNKVGANIDSTVVDGLTMNVKLGTLPPLPFEYKADIVFKLKSLTPAPLPTPDAGVADAKADG